MPYKTSQKKKDSIVRQKYRDVFENVKEYLIVKRVKIPLTTEVTSIEDAEMPMSAYEIVMICIAAIGLLLKMISVLTDRNQKP